MSLSSLARIIKLQLLCRISPQRSNPRFHVFPSPSSSSSFRILGDEKGKRGINLFAPKQVHLGPPKEQTVKKLILPVDFELHVTFECHFQHASNGPVNFFGNLPGGPFVSRSDLCI